MSRLLPPHPTIHGPGCRQLHSAPTSARIPRSHTSIRTTSTSWRTPGGFKSTRFLHEVFEVFFGQFGVFQGTGAKQCRTCSRASSLAALSFPVGSSVAKALVNIDSALSERVSPRVGAAFCMPKLNQQPCRTGHVFRGRVIGGPRARMHWPAKPHQKW